MYLIQCSRLKDDMDSLQAVGASLERQIADCIFDEKALVIQCSRLKDDMDSLQAARASHERQIAACIFDEIALRSNTMFSSQRRCGFFAGSWGLTQETNCGLYF